MEIILNKTKITVDGDSAKEVLAKRGVAFPCKGRGVCGKCVITAPALPITGRDERFLSAEELARGARLACDKILFEGVEIEANITPQRKISECDAYAILTTEYTEVGIVDGDYVEKSLVGSGKIDGKWDKKKIESVVAHELLEFLEKYDVAKATVVYIIGEYGAIEALADGVFELGEATTGEGSALRLPAEEYYIAPARDKEGSDEVLRQAANADISEAALRLVKDIRFRVKL